MNDYLIIKKMHVTEAGMDASPISVGFPAVSAVMGFVHALQRKLQNQYPELQFNNAGIACHWFEPHILQTGNARRTSMTRNPPYVKKHIDKGVPFIEEGKADMSVSLIIAFSCSAFIADNLTDSVKMFLPILRFSGGTIWGSEQIVIEHVPFNDDAGQRKMLRHLMPGFVVKERRDLIEKSMAEGADALDALLDHLEVRKFTVEEDGTAGDAETYWGRRSGETGWLVPISVGYRTLTPFGKVDNQRDPDCEHAFAENVLTLGEFVMPIRFDNVEDIMWRPSVDENQSLYVFTQNHQ